jgi:bloom syndrome protein
MQSSSAEQPEESIWLKRIFAAPASAIEKVRERLHTRMDVLSEEAADRMDAGLDDDPETTFELDDLHNRDTALESLLSKRASYLQLSVRKEELMTALKQAVRARKGVEEAKAANSKAKADLQEMESEFSTILKSCQQDLREILDAPVAAGDARTLQQIAVQSTQAPAVRPEQEEIIPSSSRIAQTQLRTEMPPPSSFQRDHKSNFTNLDHPHPSRPATSKKLAPAPVLHSDTSTFMDDEINDLDLIDASKEHYSNRMGTPPAPYDDDDFGMGDDDDMWEAAQHIVAPNQNVVQGRQVFSETSGNRQAKPPSATKSKKTTDKLSEDLERRNFSFPWSQDVKRALKERFKLKGFRESQVEAINATLAGKDVFVLMPTGGGKSLCYQLPSLVSSGKTRGVTVVVSPLVSLMEDQVAHLQMLNIQAFLINGDTSSEQRGFIMEKFGDRDVEKFIQLLYVTPEMLGKSQRMLNAFEQLHRNGRLARIVIDEAHCVSQWGHDFRPDYKALGSVRQKFPGVPVMALTATATDNVRVDTIHNLGMKGCEVFKRSFNRSNLYYEVRTKGKAAEDVDAVARLIKDNYRKQTGIVYCLSRKNCETFAKELKGKGIGAHHYHAGLQPDEKSQIQRDWQSGKHQVIVATIAFGMGIDKANVRFVVHHSMPKSLEGYYQETGRAGRDGQPSGCYLFYAYRDVAMLRKMIDQNDDASREQKNRQRQMLTRMELFCTNETDCRRVQVLNYFNEPFTRDACNGQCDNCRSDATFNSVDLTAYAQQAVSLVTKATGGGGGSAADDYDGYGRRSSSHVTVNQLVDIFRGSGGKKIKDEWSYVAEFGAGSDLNRGVVERIFHRLLSEDVLRELHVVKAGFPHQYVSLGQLREQYNQGKKFEMQIPASENAKNVGRKISKKNDASKSVGKISGPSRTREIPTSTNVSSPVQAAAKRTTTVRKTTAHQHDAFIATDDDMDDDDDDAFEPVRQVGKAPKSNVRQLGPPITSDVTMDSLDDIHRALVEQFVQEADAKCKDIMKRKGLRFQPFTTSILRQMAIDFTDTEDKMLSIRGIDPEKVKIHGKPFLALVAKYRDHYNGAMQAEFDSDDENLDGVVDKHAQNVINLVSDDDADEDEDNAMDSLPSEEDDDDGEESTYFQTAPEVAAFNARLSQVQPLGLRTTAVSRTTSKPPAKKRKKSNWVAKGSGAASASRGKARTSNLSDYRFNAETTTQRAPQRRVKSGARVGNASSSRSGSSQHTAGGNRGIEMMPT